MPFVTRKQLSNIVKNAKGFYGVQFRKRSDGQVRMMNCLNGVKKHLTGAGAKYSAEENNLIVTYSRDSNGYRSIPVEGLIAATVDGETYVAKD